MDLDRVDLIIKFAIAAASQEDAFQRELGPIHLLKLVYLADLAYAETNKGEIFTGVEWQFFHFGPFNAQLESRIQTGLPFRGLSVKKKEIPTKYGLMTRWQLTDHSDTNYQSFIQFEKKLPLHVGGSVRRAIRDFSDDTYGLLDMVYRTDPMIRAAPREILNFSKVPSIQKTKTPLEEYKSITTHKDKALKRKLKKALKKRDERDTSKRVRRTRPIDRDFAKIEKILNEQDQIPMTSLELDIEVDPAIWNSSFRLQHDE